MFAKKFVAVALAAICLLSNSSDVNAAEKDFATDTIFEEDYSVEEVMSEEIESMPEYRGTIDFSESVSSYFTSFLKKQKLCH